jgi:nitrate reductase molybdenum cofactor assembly chaperone NarJ/NarW
MRRPRRRPTERADRDTAVVYQATALLLDYPDDTLAARLPLLRAAVEEAGDTDDDPAARLVPLLDHVEQMPLIELQQEYVATFDLRRRCALYLTYYAFGDTRKRGMALLNFKSAYRKAGLVLDEGELPDHLAVVLEFAATSDLEAGRRLLQQHRAGLELLNLSLHDAGSPYAAAVAAVSATLPRIRGDERETVRRLVAEGPPEEEVGLEPFAPPEYMGAHT